MPLIILPIDLLDLNAEADMRANIELIGLVRQIILNFILRREVAAPAMAFAEAEAVSVIGRIDTGTRICVLPPCATDILVLFQNHIRQFQIIKQFAQR